MPKVTERQRVNTTKEEVKQQVEKSGFLKFRRTGRLQLQRMRR